MSQFREGARAYDPLDPCPQCGVPCHFATDFHKLGEHRVRACARCGLIWHNDDKPQVFVVRGAPPADMTWPLKGGEEA